MFFYADSTILFRKLINFIQSLFLSPNPILRFFLKKHSFVSLSSNLVIFCHKDLCISFFPALSTMSKMSYDMQLFWHRSFSWGGKPLKKKWQLDFIWTLLNIFSACKYIIVNEDGYMYSEWLPTLCCESYIF